MGGESQGVSQDGYGGRQMTDVIWGILTDNWQTCVSVLCCWTLGYLHAHRNAREQIRDLEHENDKLKWDNLMLCKMLRKREGDNEVPKSEV